MKYWHLFLPNIFKWNNYFKLLPELIKDFILSINFTMSILVIGLGIVGLVVTFFYWKNRTILKLILALNCSILILRIGYGLIYPIAIPNGLYPAFIILFILLLLLFLIPLFYFVKQGEKES